MDLWQFENNVCLVAATKWYQFFYDGFIFQVSKFFGNEFTFYFNAGGFLEVIITAEIIFIKQQVYLHATITTKYPVVSADYIITLFATVIAG